MVETLEARTRYRPRIREVTNRTQVKWDTELLNELSRVTGKSVEELKRRIVILVRDLGIDPREVWPYAWPPWNSDHPKKVELRCDWCGVRIVRYRSVVKRYKHNFCSRECHALWRKNGGKRNRKEVE